VNQTDTPGSEADLQFDTYPAVYWIKGCVGKIGRAVNRFLESELTGKKGQSAIPEMRLLCWLGFSSLSKDYFSRPQRYRVPHSAKFLVLC
jgi:hypothetical protein